VAAAIAAMLVPGLALAAAPAIGFTWAPEAPAPGQAVALTATDLRPRIVLWLWDLDGDHVPDAAGPSVTATFATPGPHVVRLQVIAVNGKRATAEQPVMVGEPVPKPAPAAIPPAGIAPPAITPAPAPAAPAPVPAPRLLTPFPIVRIQGGLLPGGVMVTRLTVQAPGGVRVRAVCHGPGCPRQSVVRRARSAGLPVRLRPLERRLGSGAVLEVFVTDPAAVGKYTRFVIRRGAAPLRRDLCVPPAGPRPARCPGD
jgi:PKD domain-containing protein